MRVAFQRKLKLSLGLVALLPLCLVSQALASRLLQSALGSPEQLQSEAARMRGLASLPFPDRVGAVGKAWLGRPYLVKSLEVGDPGAMPEPFVTRLDGFDCTTFLESSVAMARALDTPNPAGAFRSELAGLRYRGGVVGGFGDRLHYMTEWWAHNQKRGRIRDLTWSVADRQATGPINFMTQHPRFYPGLEDPTALAAVKAAEVKLSAKPRAYLSFATFRSLLPRAEEGDLLAFVCPVPGLDVAHVGLIAKGPGGVMHLLHAPQAGSRVTLSSKPLSQYLGSVPGHIGVLWARPLSPGATAP